MGSLVFPSLSLVLGAVYFVAISSWLFGADILFVLDCQLRISLSLCLLFLGIGTPLTPF
jgi:hypothetical protein